jgi:hypothetical protein
MIKEKKYNALGRRCISTKIRNPFKKVFFKPVLETRKCPGIG